MDKIRIAQANRAAGTAPVFASIEGGDFKAEGLDVELISLEGVAAADRVLHGLRVIPRLPSPEELVDLEPVAELEREGFHSFVGGGTTGLFPLAAAEVRS